MCDAVTCTLDGGRRYLNGRFCPDHTPAKMSGRPEPPEQDTSWIARSRPTNPSTPGATDIDKLKPGGYMSRQRAQRIAASRDAQRERERGISDG